MYMVVVMVMTIIMVKFVSRNMSVMNFGKYITIHNLDGGDIENCICTPV